MNIFVTGSTGFVGKNLIKNLSGKHSIEIYNRGEKFNIKEDAVIHLAGKAHDLKNTSNEFSYFEVNTEITKDLFSSFINSTSQIFIYISSVKAIADTVNQNALMETVIPNPLTPYGKSKLAAEQYLLSQLIPEGKKLYILRPCMIHGPENKGNLNLLFKLIKWGVPWPLGAFENKRSFFSIDNFCFVIDEILKGNLEPGVYNLADSEPLSTNQVIAILGKGLNKKPIIINVPKTLIKGLGRLGDLIGLSLNTERLQKLTENYVVSNQKLINALGKNLPMTAQEGMLKTAISFTKN
jgi:nucleoside-diphosphate-sugar epimerase